MSPANARAGSRSCSGADRNPFRVSQGTFGLKKRFFGRRMRFGDFRRHFAGWKHRLFHPAERFAARTGHFWRGSGRSCRPGKRFAEFSEHFAAPRGRSCRLTKRLFGRKKRSGDSKFEFSDLAIRLPRWSGSTGNRCRIKCSPANAFLQKNKLLTN